MPDEGEDAPVVLYLTAEDVIALHADIFDSTVEEAADQLRNPNGLDGAVARPITHARYAGADIALQAAVLAHGVAESQLFIDGNKRTAMMAMLTFLDVNGWQVTADDPTLAGWLLDLAHGLSAEELTGRLRDVLTEES